MCSKVNLDYVFSTGVKSFFSAWNIKILTQILDDNDSALKLYYRLYLSLRDALKLRIKIHAKFMLVIIVGIRALALFYHLNTKHIT